MGLEYKFVLWNRYKKKYDLIIAGFSIIFLLLFAGITLFVNGETTVETLVIRGFGILAVVMLHLILVIGPLCRLQPKFLPILYNRRHLGVSMFLAALVHGGFSIFQFHSLGDTFPIYSIFTSNLDYFSLSNFPFQVLGFFALLILFAMAATSHDFFLANLSAVTWKRLHMLVYVAYVLILLHVVLGAFQQETSMFTIIVLGLGFVLVVLLHLLSVRQELIADKIQSVETDGWFRVCEVDEIEDDCAKIFTLNKERVAIFKYENKLSAIHNVCKHQGGPLGEGKIIDGCITCPWHGYQYLPKNGQSPPPYTEKVATYDLKLVGSTVFIDPNAHAEGTEVEPLIITK